MLPRRLTLLAAAGLALLLPACQPVDVGVTPRDADEAVGTPAPPARGAPSAAGLPGDLDSLLAELASTAAQWQAGARPVEVHVELAEASTWTTARVLYLAPDSDRFLLLTVTPEGTAQERPTLETLGIPAVSGAALEQVPELPAGVRQPDELAADASDPLDACGFDDRAAAVLYATGAPVSWDGGRWTETPAWTATVTDEDGSGVELDPVTGSAAPDSCTAAG